MNPEQDTLNRRELLLVIHALGQYLDLGLYYENWDRKDQAIRLKARLEGEEVSR